MDKFSYEECKSYLRSFSLKSSHQFYKKIKLNTFDVRVPKRPYYYYRAKKRNDWVSWEDFLSFRKDDKYLKFEIARDFIRGLKLGCMKEFYSYQRDQKLSNIGIPSNPNIVYKEWISSSDWLGTNSYKNIQNIEYLSYDDCKKTIKMEFPEIKNKSDWGRFDKNKLPFNIPKRPDYVYKKSGEWINWESFLDSKISPRSKSKILYSFTEAKKYLKNLCLKDQYDYIKYLKNNNIDFLPKRPDYCYKQDWNGYLDFLSCEGNRTSIGERLIMEFLEENNIEYEREKKFTSCKNINPLPFDFYLPNSNVCIEYDGELHYKSSDLFGGDKVLERIKINDSIKTKWCKSNNITLIRIKYLKKHKISDILKSKLSLESTG